MHLDGQLCQVFAREERVADLLAGSLFGVYLNGEKLFEVEDSTFPDAGKVGLWTKADSVTYFDDLEVITK